jgi:hypothetical protein
LFFFADAFFLLATTLRQSEKNRLKMSDTSIHSNTDMDEDIEDKNKLKKNDAVNNSSNIPPEGVEWPVYFVKPLDNANLTMLQFPVVCCFLF